MIIIFILIGLMVLQEAFHRFERKDLYNRIMSRDYTEYRGEKFARPISAHERVLRRWRGKDGEDGE